MSFERRGRNSAGLQGCHEVMQGGVKSMKQNLRDNRNGSTNTSGIKGESLLFIGCKGKHSDKRQGKDCTISLPQSLIVTQKLFFRYTAPQPGDRHREQNEAPRTLWK